ncbi:hypothetical protein AMAG_20310 [Allomyces macrogynus ATCC 38327]|uniref:Uncharacterized protein n=1 Tax=Allomyces macrogynus (strain ATCC 38327) TaxID=578462 RepID=A0A0L0T807_ALLM3|nr:hypothetical protein AMAG_20310 [Allomyces macrogynus ATCC 38327]|eukprot:KNE70694.1 hypothetical protein AMAG_20310 [Allomyces macrogynus ATCC 38327]
MARAVGLATLADRDATIRPDGRHRPLSLMDGAAAPHGGRLGRQKQAFLKHVEGRESMAEKTRPAQAPVGFWGVDAFGRDRGQHRTMVLCPCFFVPTALAAACVHSYIY